MLSMSHLLILHSISLYAVSIQILMGESCDCVFFCMLECAFHASLCQLPSRLLFPKKGCILLIYYQGLLQELSFDSYPNFSLVKSRKGMVVFLQVPRRSIFLHKALVCFIYALPQKMKTEVAHYYQPNKHPPPPSLPPSQ